MQESAFQHLVHGAYAAAGRSDAWLHFLRDYTAAIGADAAWFGAQSVRGSPGVSPCIGFDDKWVSAYEQHYHAHNLYIPYMGKLPVGIAFHAESIVSRADLAKSTFYFEYLAPQGLQLPATATVLERHGMEVSVLAFQWQSDRTEHAVEGSLPIQQRLVEHLIGALELHDRILDLEQDTRQLLSAFDVADRAVLVCSAKGQVIAASAAANAILARRDGLGYREQRLVALSHGPRGDELGRLMHDVAQLAQGTGSRAPRTLSVPRTDGESVYQLSVFPLLDPDASETRASPHLVVFLHDPDAGSRPGQQALRQLYDLTEREARTVALLLEGQRLPDIAQQLGVTRETVKSHLSRAFRKTNTHSQTELLAKVLQGVGRFALH